MNSTIGTLFGLTSLLVLSACEEPAPPPGLPAFNVTASVETQNVAGSDDAADDPAIWVADQPGNTLIIGTDKQSGLYAFNLDGSVHDYLPVGRLNNADLRDGFMTDDGERVIIAASDRTNIALAVFLLDPATREIMPAQGGIIPVDLIDPYGACLYRSPIDGEIYAFINDQDTFRTLQIRLSWQDGAMTSEVVRELSVASQPEGCVADDRTGQLYIGEEAAGVWQFSAEADGSNEASLFAAVDGDRIVPDVEGLAIWPQGDNGGYLFASSQGDSAYAIYDLETGEYIDRFRITDGEIDGTSETDGIEVTGQAIGEAYPAGVFIAQDDVDDAGNQNFKIVDLRAILDGIGSDDRQ